MPKYIHIKLLKVKYTGKAIGDDIHIEVRCQDISLDVNKKIRQGTSVEINKEIGKIFVDHTILSLPLSIKIFERDPIFNDVGIKNVNLKINLGNTIPQISNYEIEIKEKRGLSSAISAAIFSITIETLVKPVFMYAPDDTTDGWLNGIRVDNKTPLGFPAYLKVRHDITASKREYITIEEGPFRGIQASVKLDKLGKSYFQKDNFQTEPLNLTYSISTKVLRLGRKKYFATEDPTMKWEKGRYDIEIPDYPHIGGWSYPEIKYSTTWFRIGHSGERYLHTGKHSGGCITLTEQNKWDKLCQKLMKARKNDGKSIGTLEIID